MTGCEGIGRDLKHAVSIVYVVRDKTNPAGNMSIFKIRIETGTQSCPVVADLLGRVLED